MLIKQAHLKKIKEDEISLAFRKWKKKRVKKGSLIKTSIGLIKILDITEITANEISHQDASKAGYDELHELREILDSKEGTVYKIILQYHSEDPRIELRNRTEVSVAELETIKTKLERFDQYSKQGDWTLAVLHLIEENPKLKASELAKLLQMDKHRLKINIRKLKNLGLTISHETGYSLSPLGIAVLKKLTNE